MTVGGVPAGPAAPAGPVAAGPLVAAFLPLHVAPV